MAKRKIGVLTGGGDAPGLNAVIYTLTKTCILKYDYELIGYKMGYKGLYLNDYMPLTLENTTGILHKGGSMLYSSNKDNLFDYVVEENGVKVKKDVSDIAVENMKKDGVDVLVVLGGDGTLTSARNFARKGVNVIGVPKTIDNDLSSTDVTFGFDTAVNIVTEALGRLHTTAESHHRIIVVEVMGRNAGWIALYGGIAGSADIILIPEIPYTIDNVVQKIKERDSRGKLFTIIVVAEGAKEVGGEVTVGKIVPGSPDPIRLGGIANKITYQLEERITEHEVRPVVLGHTQRGGETSPCDRILSCRYGSYAAKLIHEENFGNMVALKGGVISYTPLEEVIGQNKSVSPDNELVQVARDLGVSFGDIPVYRKR
ncbi:MAG: ATP-dependent 6-phosphofructokinase [Lachnospiraceae bacterium]|nr:ATP-dependent 6-phosphofructokinase [Lachnospiraceae bacterium]